MRTPTGEEIENRPARREQVGVDFADLGNRAIVDMHHQSRMLVEQFVIGVVDAAEEIWFGSFGHNPSRRCRMVNNSSNINKLDNRARTVEKR